MGDRQTLLEMVMSDALILVLTQAEGRERMTANMHPLATRALFLTTEGQLTNEELLTLLRPATPSGAVGRDTREARNLRSVGKERGLKVGDLRRHALSLLKGSAVAKADVVRAWAYAVIHAAALDAVREARVTHPALDMSAIRGDQLRANQMLNRCHTLVLEKLQQEFDMAESAAAENRPESEARMFLHAAASLVVDAMHVDRPALASYNDLLQNVYPEIDRYSFDES